MLITSATIDDRRLRGFIEQKIRENHNLRPLWLRFGLWWRRDAQRRLRAENTQEAREIARGLAIRADNASVLQGSNHVAARIHQVGGTIRPGKSVSPVTGKLTQFLSVPLAEQQHLTRYGIWPRDIWMGGDKSIFVLPHNGKLFLVRQPRTAARRQKGWRPADAVTTSNAKAVRPTAEGPMEFLYVLVREVVKKANPYIVLGKEAWDRLWLEYRQRFQGKR